MTPDANPLKILRESLDETSEAHRRADHSPSVLNPVLVGRVFANPKVPTVTNVYYSVNPVEPGGAELERGTGVLSTDGSRSLLVFVVGSRAPAAGDLLICRFVGHRWVAARTGKSNTGVFVTGCPCLLPKTLKMSVVNSAANFHMFHDATLVWGPVPPALAPLGLGANAFLSNESFKDDFSADPFQYHIFCSSGFYCLTRVYAASIYGSPYLEATRYRWLSGLPGNTCAPFLLTNGKIFSGGDASTVITLSE